MERDKKKLLADLHEQTEIILNRAIAEWQLIPHSKFARKPDVNEWSANECVQHLNSYGRYYLPAIEKAMAVKKGYSTKTFSSGWLGKYFTDLMTVKPNGKISKTKSPKNHSPTSLVESHVVIAEFIEQQERLLKLLRNADEVDLNIRLPISLTKMIRLKLGDVFMFYVAHQQRHFQQAERALKNSGSAKIVEG
jgi:DinB superfamily